jgi:hypothetical protein
VDRIDPIRPRPPQPESIPAIRRTDRTGDQRRDADDERREGERRPRPEDREPPPDDGRPHVDVTV